MLFDVTDLEAILEKAILDNARPAGPVREKRLDVAIDGRYGIIEVGEQRYYTSELLFAADYAAYRDLGDRLCTSGADSNISQDGRLP